MLVQQKLLQIQDSRTKHGASRKVYNMNICMASTWFLLWLQEAQFLEWIQKLEREKELLSHTLADRNAELQLQISKTNVIASHFSTPPTAGYLIL